MRKIKKWRYYCDFCNKGGGHAGYMRSHELSCTMNPNRTCNMCYYAGEYTKPEDLSKMVSIIKEAISFRFEDIEMDGYFFKNGFNEEDILKKIREISRCPACILSALRQSGVPFMFDSFDYKKEKESLWADVNEDRWGNVGYIDY